MPVIEFTDNDQDLSTDLGKQCKQAAAQCPDCGTPLGKKFCADGGAKQGPE